MAIRRVQLDVVLALGQVVAGVVLLIFCHRYVSLIPDDSFTPLTYCWYLPGMVIGGWGVIKFFQVLSSLQPAPKVRHPSASSIKGKGVVFPQVVDLDAIKYEIELMPGLKTEIDRKWMDAQLRALASLYGLERDSFQLFEPDAHFYLLCADGGENPARLIEAAGLITAHLGLDVMVMVSFNTLDDGVGGLIDLVDENGCYFIEINERFRHQPSALGAILAHEVVHIYELKGKIPKLGNLRDELNIDMLIHLMGLGLLPLLGAKQVTLANGGVLPHNEIRHHLSYLPWGLIVHGFVRMLQAHEIEPGSLHLEHTPDRLTRLVSERYASLGEPLHLYPGDAERFGTEPNDGSSSAEDFDSLWQRLLGADELDSPELIVRLMESDDVVQRLISLLHEGSDQARLLATDVLGALGPKAALASRFLSAIAMSDGVDSPLRVRCLMAVGYIGHCEDIVLSSLRAGLADDCVDVACAAVEAVGRIDIPAEERVALLDQLTALLNGDNPKLQEVALRVEGKLQ